VAGIDVGLAVFKRIDPTLEMRTFIPDGGRLKPGDVIADVRGRMAPILKAERTALNFVRRLSGVATETAKYVRAVEGLPVRIVDTRKTTPGLRSLEKYAVKAGGGFNHRQNLGDGILIKDNHIEMLARYGMTLGDVVRKAVAGKSHTINVEVEVDNLDQLQEALDAGASLVLLDNMSLEQLATAVALAKGRAVLEASGNITLDKVRAVAETGVDIISVGALTHSSQSLDLSLDIS
jgi:nicotinate-nucleotide pyrophosphorylase (carboxylating)